MILVTPQIRETCHRHILSCRAKRTVLSPVRLCLAVPWCATSRFLLNVERSTVSVGCYEELSRFQWISLDVGIKCICQAGFMTIGVRGVSGDVKFEGSLKSLPTVICRRVRCVAPGTVIHAKLQFHNIGRKVVHTSSDNETTGSFSTDDCHSVVDDGSHARRALIC